MLKSILKNFGAAVGLILSGWLLVTLVSFAQTWSGPTQAPPGGNTPTPVNVGPTSQTKLGGLWVGSLGISGGATIGGNLGIGTVSPTAKLDLNGQLAVRDGTQGVGKVLTSDAAGLASWQTLAGGASCVALADVSPAVNTNYPVNAPANCLSGGMCDVRMATQFISGSNPGMNSRFYSQLSDNKWTSGISGGTTQTGVNGDGFTAFAILSVFCPGCGSTSSLVDDQTGVEVSATQWTLQAAGGYRTKVLVCP